MKKNKPPKKYKYKNWRNKIWYALMILAVLSIFSASFTKSSDAEQVAFSDLIQKIKQGEVQEVVVKTREQLIIGKYTDEKTFRTHYVNYDSFIEDLQENNVKFSVNTQDSSWFLGVFLQFLLPFLMIGFLWFFIFRQAQSSNNQALSFGKSKASPWKKEDTPNSVPKTTFKNIAGIDEAVEELREIVDFLKSPQKFKKLGAKIPKGALLMGSPGTGKTLLAKAIAGEANVPFFSLSGSEFVEMFVGVGASRVRDLFSQAKKVAPSIIFVDEIDAVGRHRGAGLGGGHDEREQTLNQLLVEMDGFAEDVTVIVIAATNRPDILDPALLRPGRFDRQITVDKPDLKGREQILAIHVKGKKIDKDVDLKVIARATSGFTGADLANLMNESALLAARNNRNSITSLDVEESIERVIAGPQRKSRVMSDHEKKVIAYHETGHALVAALLPEADPVHKVSILPRGMALGYTLQLPEEDRFLVSKNKMLTDIKVLLAGRIAEEIAFNEITSGASNDIERATEIARSFICKYGMSDKLRTRKYGRSNGNNVFLGKQYTNDTKDYSDQTAREIDEEIINLIDECYQNTKSLLETHRSRLDFLSLELLEREVVERKEFLELLEKDEKELLPPADTEDDDKRLPLEV